MTGRSLALAAGITALLSIGGPAVAQAQAELMQLDMTAPQWGLSSHQVRVVQFALRDAGCYDAPIDGNVNARTRQAMQCARQKMNVAQGSPMEVARALNLYTAASLAQTDGRNTGGMMNREAAGDVNTSNMRDKGMPRTQNGMNSGNMNRNNMNGMPMSGARTGRMMPDSMHRMMPDSMRRTMPDSMHRMMPDSMRRMMPDSMRRMMPDSMHRTMPDSVRRTPPPTR